MSGRVHSWQSLPRAARAVALALASLVLASCGGGGGGGTPTTPVAPPAPTVNVTLAASANAGVSGDDITLTWSTSNFTGASCDASGAWSGQQTASGSKTLALPAQGTATYTLSCGSATGSVNVAVAAPRLPNVIPVHVDGGLINTGAIVNAPFVSVTLCRPGTTICQTINNVLVDTGSSGLRLSAALLPELALPAVKTSAGAEIGACGHFASGYTWGALVQADIKLGGETASAQSVQLTTVSPAAAATPTGCSSIGADIGSVASMGSNGILGVGGFQHDCDFTCVVLASNGVYYGCVASGCTGTKLALAQQVSNPVSAFAKNNNGVILALPDVPAGGVSTLAGTLTFGIGTDVNNAIAGEKIFGTNSSGDFTTTYKGATLSASFIDSGANGLFFKDPQLTPCTRSSGFYCPLTRTALSATILGAGGTSTSQISFTLENADTLGPGIRVATLGADPGGALSGATTFAWGLPFFFGRKVFVGIETATANPYWAF
ncbi:MAG: DUF3443 family protein [Massilia sp.]